MASPADCKYTDSHEWHRNDSGVVTVGITKFAVSELTDITYAELKPVGATIEPGGAIGEVESVKATSDVYSAVGGEIVEVNQALIDNPSLLNDDPYDKGWLVKIKPADTAPLDALMDAKAYDAKYAG
ncbi:MAG: glycine cleavage system protein GcvH [Phycisphaerales bacterium]